MDDFKKKLVHLHHCRGASWKTIFYLLKNDPMLQSLYETPAKESFPSLSSSTVKSLYEDLHSKAIQERISTYSHENIHFITYFDPEYPELLKEIYQPPWVLYGKGNLKLLESRLKLAVVGSRRATEYGRRAVDALFPKLVDKGILFVSGLAKGIDVCAHRTAIKHGGQTIGVIAGGFHHIYPIENKELAHYMMEHHLLVSEYPPHAKPLRWHFPMRNRIISGLCQGTLVVEAQESSGSLITANFAVQEGREVFALPGNIFSSNSAGTNELIQQGAKLVQKSEDILDELLY